MKKDRSLPACAVRVERPPGDLVAETGGPVTTRTPGAAASGAGAPAATLWAAVAAFDGTPFQGPDPAESR